MLAELRDDNKQMAAAMREAHGVCEENEDVAGASLIEAWIDETERRTWFLFEASRRGEELGRWRLRAMPVIGFLSPASPETYAHVAPIFRLALCCARGTA